MASAVAIPNPRRSSPTRRSIMVLHHASVLVLGPSEAPPASGARETLLRVGAAQRPAADKNPAADAGRVAGDEGVRRPVGGHDGPHADHGVWPDDEPGTDARAGADRGTLLDPTAQRVIARRRAGEAVDTVREGARIAVVGEGD